MYVIVGKVVVFGEVLYVDFKIYIDNVFVNVQVFGEVLKVGGVDFVMGGIDNYLLLVDLCLKGLKGVLVEQVLECVGIICNKNGILFDIEKLIVMLGICFGMLVGMMCGFGVVEFCEIGCLIFEVFDVLCVNLEGDYVIEQCVCCEIFVLCECFLIY